MGINKTKDYLKKNFRVFYDVSRSVGHGIKESKLRRLSEKRDQVIHKKTVQVDSEIAKLFCFPTTNRINLVFSEFTTRKIEGSKQSSELLTIASKFARNNDYALRIIARNELPNPKVYSDFLEVNHLKMPESISFYTDKSTRVSCPVHRLEVTDGDVFFLETEVSKLKEWIKNGK